MKNLLYRKNCISECLTVCDEYEPPSCNVCKFWQPIILHSIFENTTVLYIILHWGYRNLFVFHPIFHPFIEQRLSWKTRVYKLKAPCQSYFYKLTKKQSWRISSTVKNALLNLQMCVTNINSPHVMFANFGNPLSYIADSKILPYYTQFCIEDTENNLFFSNFSSVYRAKIKLKDTCLSYLYEFSI